MTNTNPLSQFYRQYRKYVALPSSGGDYLSESVITYTGDKREVGVKPMTAADEIMFKNPDALLNGEAIDQVIKSCVPEVKQPRKLLENDISVLLVAIYSISQGESYDLKAKCPECKHDNLFALNLNELLDHAELLEANYPVNLSTGLTAFVSPHTYEMSLKTLALQFEEAKFLDTLDSFEIPDPEKIKRISQTIKRATQLTFDLVADSVSKIVKENPGEEPLVVTDKKYIKEFLENIEVKDSKVISKKIEEIKKVGLPNEYDAECQECNHNWKADISFNPTDFFTAT